jgi:hypothetical protein
MKKLSLLLMTLFVSFPSFALEFKVLNLCENTTAYHTDIQLEHTSTVGDLSEYFLKRSNLDFGGNRNGVNTLLGTAVGDQAIEIISDERMRVYGWCYEIDGKYPDMLMSEFVIEPNQVQSITWFYGYAELVRHDWISYCTPVQSNPHPYICKQN